MLALTTFTTFLSGLVLADPALPGSWQVFEAMTFPAALLAVLMAHELGHFLACRRHGLDATLPLFIPAPPFPVGLGTFGAFIRIREPIRFRHQLLDVGAAGPLAGMLLALPLTIVGLHLSTVAPVTDDMMGLQFGESLLFTALREWIVGPLPLGYDVFLHPIGMAGWLGLFVTSLNLIMAGQLDGGHVFYALFGPLHRVVSRTFFLALVFWGMLGDLQYQTWLQIPLIVAICVWAIVLSFRPVRRKLERNIFLALLLAQIALQMTFGIESASTVWVVWGLLVYIFGLDHPPVSDIGSPLNWRRRLAGLACLVIFVLTFLPLPVKVI
ncbi:MAG TPA: site-2 protease family protein [bacterium]|nr:site-2 protease family protein [bacterium]